MKESSSFMNSGRTKGASRTFALLSGSELKGPAGYAFDILIATALTALIAVLDYATGIEIAFSFFYLFPVSLISWRRGLALGALFSFLCSATWFLLEAIGGREYSHWLIYYWNAGIRGSIFLTTAFLLSKLKEAIRLADESRDAALAASHAKSDFLSSMSHEIRTPLNAIMAMSDTLSETRLDADQTEYVRIFRREGRRLLTLIDDLLDSAKVEAGRFEAECVVFSLRGLLEEVMSILGAQAGSKGLEFAIEAAPNLPSRILGDPILIRRTILNLTGNAVKFTSKGRITLKADLVQAFPGEKLRITVSDTGIGVPKDALARLFQPFSQADPSIGRRYGGTGLGLSLCRRFVELMGGEISVFSRPGEGSDFSFTVPLQIPGEGESEQEFIEEKKGRVHSRPLRILLVEDYDINRAIVKTFLKQTPYLVEEAENGEIGVSRRKSWTFDLILMDIQMPVMDGLSATKAIRLWEKESGAARIPIVAMTAHAFEDDIRESERAGCDAYLVKPYTKGQLLEAIFSSVSEQHSATAASRPSAVVGDPASEAVKAATDVSNPVGNDSSLQPAPDLAALDPDVKALVPAFLEDLARLLHSARGALERRDFVELKGIGHKLKGAGGSFGFDSVSELGGRIEALSFVGKEERLGEILSNLEEFLKRMEKHGH